MATKQEILKKKKKKWYSVTASNDFRNAVLGESYVDDINFLKGRVFKVNLMNITGDFKKQNINAGFIVNNIEGDHASADLISYEITPSYTRRLTKKAKTKVEDSFKLVSSDKIGVIIKILVIAKTKINRSVATALRKKSREIISEFLSKKTYDDFAKAVVFDSMQKEMRDKLNKIIPVPVCLIRVFKRINK